MKRLAASLSVPCSLQDLAPTERHRRHSQSPPPADVRDVYDEVLYRRWQSYFFETQRFA